MRTFQRYFKYNTPLEKIDMYVRLVLKTFDIDDDVDERFTTTESWAYIEWGEEEEEEEEDWDEEREAGHSITFSSDNGGSRTYYAPFSQLQGFLSEAVANSSYEERILHTSEGSTSSFVYTLPNFVFSDE